MMSSEVAHFSIDYTRFLDPEGRVVGELPAFAKDRTALLHLYRVMLQTRLFDTKAITLQRTGKMGTYASSLGQEAIGAALGAVMHPEDVLCPAYRETAAQIQRGVKMLDILQYWGGDERGNNFAGNKEDFPICVPIGSQCLHAAGIAFAFHYRQQPRVAVAVLGDGGTSQGEFYEAMNIAGIWKLPVLFLVNNNQWAISLPRHAQTAAKTLAQKAIAAGFDGEQVDGNDVIALRAVLEGAMQKIRSGKGPHLIEAITYRLHDHTTADDANRYRQKEELEHAQKEEPLLRLRTYLRTAHHFTEDEEKEITLDCTKKIEETLQAYASLDLPAADAMFDHQFAVLPVALKTQREEAEKWMK